MIVGHQQADIELVESVLCCSGMKIGTASHRDRLCPRDLVKLLSEEYRTHPTDSQKKSGDFRQVEPPAMWDSVLLDLAIGNAANVPWGWADSNAISLVDFWLKHDPYASVIFVYEDPASLVDDHIAKVGEKGVQHQLETWAGYNAEMLSVFTKYRSRCMMANITKLHSIPSLCIEKLGMALTWSGLLSAKLSPDQNLTDEKLQDDQEEFTRLSCAAKYYLGASYLQENREYEQLYGHLQVAADLPDDTKVSFRGDNIAIWESLAVNPQLLARSYHQIHTSLLDYETRISSECNQNEDLFLQLQQLTEEAEEYRQQIKQIAEKITLEERLAAKKRLKQELRYRLGDILISSMRTPTGWFRMPFALIRETRRPTVNAGKEVRVLSKNEKKNLTIKQQLSYRLGSKLVKHAKTPIGWVTLPFVLLLETIAFKRQRRKR